MTVLVAGGDALSAAGVASVALTVTPGPSTAGTYFQPITVPCSRTPAGAWSASIGTVPSGPRRQFTVTAYGDDARPRFAGGAVADVVAGRETALELVLMPTSPSTPTVVSTPVVSVGLGAAAVAPGGWMQVVGTATDAAGGALALAWTSTCGAFDAPTAASTIWRAPSVPNRRCLLTFSAASDTARTTVSTSVDVLWNTATRPVMGSRTRTCWIEPASLGPGQPEASRVEVPAADALTLVPPDALVPDGAGGWSALPGGHVEGDGTYYAGTFSAAGEFFIPGLTGLGTYLLSFDDGSGVHLLVETGALGVDLGYDAVGPCGPAPLRGGTGASFVVVGLDPWDSSASELQAASSRGEAGLVLASGAAIMDGTTLAVVGQRWSVEPPTSIWISQLSPALHPGGFSYAAASRAGAVWLSPPVPGAVTTYAVPLGEVPFTGALALQWNLATFEPLRAQLAPVGRVIQGAVAPHRVSVFAGPFATRYPSPRPAAGALELLRFEPPAGSTALGLGTPLAYGQFLPAAWHEWREVRSAVVAEYLAPGANSTVELLASITQREPLPAPAAVAPLAGPVTAPRISGADALADLAAPVGPAPTFSWTAPLLGANPVYAVEVLALGVGQGGVSTVTPVVRYLTRSTRAALPPGLLATGTTYLARITTIVSDVPLLAAPYRWSTARAEASVLTGTFTP